MAYNLYFYREKSEKSEKRGISGFFKGFIGKGEDKKTDMEITGYLSSLGNFSDHEFFHDGFDAGYLNEKTGTHIALSMHRDTIPEIETDHRYQGYGYTGMSAVMIYNRPHYQMLEAAPVIEALCTRFNFLVYNPQESEELTSCSPESLIRTYTAANDMISEHNKPRPRLHYNVYGTSESIPWMPRDASFRFWQYTMNRDAILTWLKDNDLTFKAPEIMVYCRKSDNSLHQVIELSAKSGYLIPSSCDGFLVDSRSPRPRLVLRDSVREYLNDLLKPVSVMNKKFHSLSVRDTKKVFTYIKDVPSDDIAWYDRCSPGLWIDVA